MSLRLIAASLGLSVTTISRALAGYSDVAEETRLRVRAEAERIGYVPNITARRLQKGRTDAIGVVAPSGPESATDAFLFGAFSGAWSRLSELDRDLLMLPSMVESGPRDCGTFRRAVDERRVDGLLLLRTRRDDWRISYLREARIPFVVFGADHRDMPDVVAIGGDDDDAARQVVDRLFGFGHRHIACVLPEGDFDFALARLEAFRRRTAERGVQLTVAEAAFTEAGGYDAATRLICPDDAPTAIVFFSNRMALGGLQAIAATVLVIGRHVSVISFGDNSSLAYATPPVTAMYAPGDAMARHAIDLLVMMCEKQPIDPIRTWPWTLVQRLSDGPLVERPRARANFACGMR